MTSEPNMPPDPNRPDPGRAEANPPVDAAQASPEVRETAGLDGGSVAEPPVTPEQEAELLRAALADARAEIDRQIDAVQRGQADLANARRRHDEERLNIQQQANSRLLVQLLPIVDELDLAVNHLESGNAAAPDDPAADSWARGVRLIQRKLAGFLEAQGVAKIESIGEPFNPELHEAVGMAQVDGAESGSIVEVLRQGYLLHDRVVQVAQVVVNQ